MGKARPPFWVVMQAHFRADPRKTVVLIVLTVVMIVVYVRMVHKPSSSRAAVSTDESVHVTEPAPESEAFPLPTAGDFQRVEVSLPAGAELERDPFHFDLRWFPLAPGAGPEAAGSGEDTEGRESYEAIREAAGELELLSTLVGGAGGPIACINGRIVHPGDTVEGFLVESVEPSRVVVRRRDVRIALVLR